MLKENDLIVGNNQLVPTAKGPRRYINFDNAASTPPFQQVIQTLNEAALWYSSVHRGSGYKSKYSTHLYEDARRVVANFVAADLEQDIVIFTRNTTDSLNKLRHYLRFLPGEIVVYTHLEHHSNELPWAQFPSRCLNLDEYRLDLAKAEEFLRKNAGRIKLLAITGASNVTGYLPPIYTLAELAHAAGAKILVDGAQLVPHRPITMYPASDPRHIDFLAFSGHKIYAPFGSGVLIGPRSLFTHPPPSEVGGGTVKGIGPAGIIWSEPPEVEEAGSPNVLGAVALAEAIRVIQSIGWPKLIAHENQLIQQTIEALRTIPEVILYNPDATERVGVISFNLMGFHHQAVADYLSEAWGIGVRSGCFCARGYVQKLLKLNSDTILQAQNAINSHNSHAIPGMVRVSFGCYNELAEVDILIQALKELIKKPL